MALAVTVASHSPLAVTIELAAPDGALSGPAMRVLDALRALAELQLAAAYSPSTEAPSHEVGPAPELSLHTASRQVFKAGRALHMTRREYELLAFLCEHPRQVFSRAQLLRLVWGYHSVGGERTVDVHILRLRSKLGADGPTIVTVRGIGYRLDDVHRISVNPGKPVQKPTAAPDPASPHGAFGAFDRAGFDAAGLDGIGFDGAGSGKDGAGFGKEGAGFGKDGGGFGKTGFGGADRVESGRAA